MELWVNSVVIHMSYSITSRSRFAWQILYWFPKTSCGKIHLLWGIIKSQGLENSRGWVSWDRNPKISLRGDFVKRLSHGGRAAECPALATLSSEVKYWQTHHVCLFCSPGLFLHPPHCFVTRGLAPFLELQFEDPQDEIGLVWLKKGGYHKTFCREESKAPMAGKRTNSSPNEEKMKVGKS